MKKNALQKGKSSLSFITMSAVLANVLFLPPFLPEEKFDPKKEIVKELNNRDDLYHLKKDLLYRRMDNNKINSMQNLRLLKK